ncbi:MAG: helix-turn-helix domain-containing protein [Chloroflexi bacterium]|nr:helix-turn-helix domain-containing protein [Chloroflexota bacterium]
MSAEQPTADVSNQVRQRRLAHGLSQQALAEQCSITRQAIHAIETGRYVPNTAVALRLARALSCTVEALFTLPDNPRRIRAELLDGGDHCQESLLRVQVARVGQRVLAVPLSGRTALTIAAGGLAAVHGRSAEVDLLVDPATVEHAVVVSGCDPALALLGAHLARRHPTFHGVWVEENSLASLRSLKRGMAHVAGTHLRDAASGDFNVPCVQRELAGSRVIIVTFSEWEAGIVVAPGNPRRIRRASDLARPDVTIVNREQDSGARHLLDAWLCEGGVPSDVIRGYGHVVRSHFSVAEAIALGTADAGPSIRAAALALGLGFVTLQRERYDLVIPAGAFHSPAVMSLLDTAVSAPFRRELAALGGYDTAKTGAVVTELPAAC